MVKATGQHHLMPAGILKPCPWERPVDNEAMLNTQHLYKHTAFWRNLKSLAAHFTILFVESAEHLVRSAVTSRVANKKKRIWRNAKSFFYACFLLKKAAQCLLRGADSPHGITRIVSNQDTALFVAGQTDR